MKSKRLLLLSALLIVCAFFLHVAAMFPSREALCRAEALEYLLAQDDPAALESFAPYLEGDAAPIGDHPEGEADRRAGERMLLEADRLYYYRPGCTRAVVFEMKSEK